MSDVDYTPATPPGTEHPAQTIPAVNSDELLNQIPKGTPERQVIFGEGEQDEPLSIEQAALRLRERRTKDADLVRYSDQARPRTDKAAAQDLTATKRIQRASNIATDFPGVGDPIAQAIEIERGGRIHEFPLGDEKAPPLSHGDTPEEATSRLRKMREERIAEMSQILAQQLPPEALAEAAPPEQQQQPQQPPQEQPPPSVDPLESERQRVQQEAATLAALRNMSAQEIQQAYEAQLINTFITQKHGAKVQQAGSLEALRKTDPGAVNEILQAQAAYNHRMAQIQSQQQLREANEVLLQNTRATELARVNRVEGEKAATEFTKYVEARDPQWKSDPDYRQSLQKMALDIVEEVAPGSSAAIQRGEMYVTTGQQKALYDVARARLSDERIKQTMELGRQKALNDLPKVQRPGVALSKGEISAGDQSAQLRQLPGMSPTDAARLGARLLAQRRGAR